MRCLTAFALIITPLMAFAQAAQGHDTKPADALKNVSFLEGNWKGKVSFNTGQPEPMVGDVTDTVKSAISGHYIEESLSTTLPGRAPSDTRHFLTYDPGSGLYKAWWFNDASTGAMELEGSLSGNKLVLETKSSGKPGPVFRATYDKISDHELGYQLELKAGDAWRLLFHTTYAK